MLAASGVATSPGILLLSWAGSSASFFGVVLQKLLCSGRVQTYLPETHPGEWLSDQEEQGSVAENLSD